ncbi:hypothetical protein B0E41_25480 [Hydrogenophaga sp. A37]|uniref:hypothetical protein n=1 Tax=Hydrogenophaga sp. A37 TaxID=1945864 RepID=UPI00098625F8|nr:hypothetical protein [Hydrogenophaga sp. A37]OOG79179.1 hypothetical protein B0E41_25480 [Hydrogenophaga sp. A37]
MEPFKPGDTVVLTGPVTSGGRAQPMTGWEIFAALKRVPDGSADEEPAVAMTGTWVDAAAGIARLVLVSAQSRLLRKGFYSIDVILRRTSDGHTTTTNSATIEFVDRVTPLPPAPAPAPAP